MTALFGVMFAAVQTDMKRLLAYSSIENIGIIFTGIGLTLIFHTYHAGALAARRILLPWVKANPTETNIARKIVPELEGGSWARGRKVFFSEEALCSKCHAVGGQGSKIGPDLSNLIHRDYDSVLRDIRDPSAALNPDFIAYELTLKNGETLIGTVRTEAGDKLNIGQGPG
jgi:hypothetical protein